MKLGRVNVNAMLRSITAKQFLEWQAYARLEPFNELRDDYRAASIAQMVYNMAVAKAKDRKHDVSEFLLTWKEVDPKTTVKLPPGPRKQTWQEQQKLLELMALAFNAPGVNADVPS